ncbi:amino acid/amide ABC transporter ATP-binding protein 2, HAAT family [Lacrimispora sphenoides]|jgi:branched-chain amino acid transport system ATP-binding protein|uniref:ABC transporter ATP-binding protein n=1 Tax=Lacrimispora sphenoides TaxID=29370 RepID=UPI0008D29B18|nr:amino acid/amide ABC transporter ATP-binding protein 2, HAAT family [Lacrimispora sphenoides]
MAPLLEVKNLNYSYGNIHVVKDVNLYINEGEIVTLIGANGAGKTTTLRTISGLTDASGVKGEIIFNGKNIQKMPGNKITALGLCQVLEGRHIFSKLTVRENLLVGAYTRKDMDNVKKELEEIYTLFPRLRERMEQLGGTLSGGEQQMLAIGRALLGKPKLLLLDEPSLGLAPLVIREIFEAIVRIRNTGMTIMFVEQNSKIALETADRGYVVQNGQIVMEDTCENLASNEEVKKAYLGED